MSEEPRDDEEEFEDELDDDELEEDEEELESCECPVLDADEWDEVESDWSDIVFIRGNMRAAMGVPLGYGTKRLELERRAAELGAEAGLDAMFLLGEGRFSRPILLELEEDPGGDAKDIYRPGGVAYTRLIPAPYGEFKKRADAFVEEATEEYGRHPDGLWVWYLTCRTCSAARDFETLFVAHYAEA